MTPFNCSPFGYQLSVSTLIQLDLSTGQSKTLGTLSPANNVNAIGYNETDGYMYGYDITTNRVAKIGSDLALQDLPAVANLPAQSWNIGDVDKNGYLYLAQGSGVTFAVVDVNPSRATYGNLVDPATKAVTTTVSTLTGAIGGALVQTGDWAFNNVDGLLYYVKNTDGIVRRVDPTTGVVTALTTTGAATGVYGSAFFDAAGNLYAVDNNTGAIYKYVLSGTTATRSLFSNAGAATGGDGARCAKAPINFAYFDAPITKVATPVVALGETITYTLVINNTGNISANNVTIIDTIPNGATFNSNSILVNNVSNSGNPSPPAGVNIGTLGLGVSTITFTATATTVPSPNPTPNVASVSYEFTDPGSGLYRLGVQSTIASTTIVALTTTTTKTVDKAFAKVGDILTYTIVVTPSGNITSISSVFIDTIPSGTTLVSNSLNQDGTLIGGSPNPPGVTLPNILKPGILTTISFKVTVTTMPSPNTVLNNSSLSFTFQGNFVINKATNSNQVTTQINQATIDNTNGGGLVKERDKSFAQVGDVITYTIGLKNTGNVTANSVIFTDTTPNGTTFISDSFTINSVQAIGVNPNPPSGVNVGDIGPSNATTVTFQVRVTTIPSPNPIPNNSTVKFTFLVDQSVTIPQNGSGNSNQVITQVNQAIIDNTNGGGLVKSVDKAFAKMGDVITYTIALKNTGNVTASSVVFTDTIPTDTTFVANSVILNGTVQIGASPDPPTGVTIGTIAAGSVSTMIFKVIVNTMPSPNPIQNSGTVNYNFAVIPTIPNSGSSSGNTNEVTTQVNQAIIDNTNGGGMVKSVNETFAKIGDILTYTIGLANTGNVTASSVIFTDTTPNGTTFISDSFTINSVQYIGANPNPPTGVNVGDIGPSKATTVTFKVRVTTIPSPNPIPNNSTVKFNFTSDPANPDGNASSGNSNQVTTQVNQANLNSSKSNNIVYGDIGDTITYTVLLTNYGNTTATNVIIIDTIPNGGEFILNSVTIDSINKPGLNPSPPLGFTIPDIAINSTVTIQFAVQIITIPSPNPMENSATSKFDYIINPLSFLLGSGSANTNKVSTFVNTANISIVKNVNKQYATINNTLTYTFVLNNIGTTTSNNITLIDTIPNETSFVSNSLQLNGTVQGGASPLPPSGFNLATLGPFKTATITFDVTINSLPSNWQISNYGEVNYSYNVNPVVPDEVVKNSQSNVVITNINRADLNGIAKFVDKTYAKCSDIINYTIVAPNTGNTTAFNVILKDTIPNGTTFVTNSVKINGITQPGANPSIGITMPSIAPGDVTTLTFSVQVQCV